MSPHPNWPFLELFGGDQPGPKVCVTDTLGLPPCWVILAHHLQNLPSLKWQPSLLARDSSILLRVVGKEGSHEHLAKKEWNRMMSSMGFSEVPYKSVKKPLTRLQLMLTIANMHRNTVTHLFCRFQWCQNKIGFLHFTQVTSAPWTTPSVATLQWRQRVQS